MWDLIMLGSGTAGYWAANLLLRRPAGSGPRRLVLVDRSPVKPNSLITCPEYRGHVGEPKCAVLARLASSWAATTTLQPVIESVFADVRALDWPGILSASACAPLVLAVVALDDWAARLGAIEDARRAALGGRARLLFVQVGLDRDQAQLAVYGQSLDDPCPACGMSCLPQTEPCVVLTSRGTLLRGDLHAEACAAARLLRRIVRVELIRPGTWLNVKANLHAAADNAGRQRWSIRIHRAARAAGCFGAHDAAPPVAWPAMVACGNGDLPDAVARLVDGAGTHEGRPS